MTEQAPALLVEGYGRLKRRTAVLAAAFAALSAAALVFSVGVGAMHVPFGRVADIILSKIVGNQERLLLFKPSEIAVIWEIRLPRVLAGYLVGAGLAAAGVVFQALLGNALADPYTLGVSTGAAFGASLMIVINLMLSTTYPLVPFAFLFAALALFVVLMMAEKGGGLKASNLIIAGMIVSAVLSSAISFLKMLAGENVSAIVYWMMGSVSAKSWGDLVFLFPLTAAGTLIAILNAPALNVMTLGDRAAEALGVEVKKVRLGLLLAGAMITAACVSTSGIIGFVGLIVPHMLRMAVSGDNRRLLPLSYLSGGLLLMLADDAARMIGNGDIPVGVLTTLLGGPFFIYLFLRKRRKAC